jgi:excisionase family DNA binding protein
LVIVDDHDHFKPKPKAEVNAVELGPWLTADKAAAYLGLRSRKALYECVRRGQLPARRVGQRTLRFSTKELDDALVGGWPPASRGLPSGGRRPSATERR